MDNGSNNLIEDRHSLDVFVIDGWPYEAPNFATVTKELLRQGHPKEMFAHGRYEMK
ncbi:hypothetical protein Ccrd_023063, partial [Cynara cardunculus var. scolymus]